MTYTPWPANGCTLADARQRVIDSSRLKESDARIAGYKSESGHVAYLRHIGIDSDLEVRGLPRLRKAIDELTVSINAAFRDHLEGFRLAAYGRPRDLAAEPTFIEPDIWPALRNVDWKASAIGENRKGGALYLAVRVHPVLRSPAAAELVTGHSLAHAFRRFILDDPEVATLGRQAIKIEGGLSAIFDRGRCTVSGVGEWPVAQKNPSGMGTDPDNEASPLGILAPSRPPRAVTAAFDALYDRYEALLDLLRGGELLARGIPTRQSLPDKVLRTAWSNRAFYLDAMQGDLLEINPKARNPPHDFLIKRWSALVLEAHARSARPMNTPLAAEAISKQTQKPSNRRRHKSDAVLKAIRGAGIDLTGTGLGPKAIASKVAAHLPFKVESAEQHSALAKMIGRLQNARRAKR